MSIWCVQNYKFCSSERVNFKISIWCLFVDLLYILSWQTTKLISESHQNHYIIWMSYLWHHCDVHFMTHKFGVQILISVWHQPDVTICTCDLPVTCWCESYFKLTQKWCHGATWDWVRSHEEAQWHQYWSYSPMAVSHDEANRSTLLSTVYRLNGRESTSFHEVKNLR